MKRNALGAVFALVASIIVSTLGTPAHAGVLTVDIFGFGIGRLDGNLFAKPFDFHFVANSSNGGAQLTEGTVTLGLGQNSQTYDILDASQYSIGLNQQSPLGNAPYYLFFGPTGGSDIFRQFFNLTQFQNLANDNNSNSFSANSLGFLFSNSVIPTSGGDLRFLLPSLGGGISGTDTGDSVSAVPELSTWIMMLLGFAGIGFAAYRRAKNTSVAIAAT